MKLRIATTTGISILGLFLPYYLSAAEGTSPAAIIGSSPTEALSPLLPQLQRAPSSPLQQDAGNVTRDAEAAYIYGYPLLAMKFSELLFILGNNASTNTFLHARTFPSPSDKTVVRPNLDTLYSVAFLDLSKGPIVLNIPDTQGQYFLMQMLDGWTNVFANPGARTTGTGAQRYTILGPKDRSDAPIPGSKALYSPTNLVWILGRTLVSNSTSAGYQQAHDIQDKYSLQVINKRESTSTTSRNAIATQMWQHQTRVARQQLSRRPKRTSETAVGGDVTVPGLVSGLSGNQFFLLLSFLMCDNPAFAADAPALKQFESIGFKPCGQYRPSIRALGAILSTPRRANQKIVDLSKSIGESINGWRLAIEGMGNYGVNYNLRAAVALTGIGANLPEDALYPTACTDQSGAMLEGSKSYRLTFKKGLFPPVSAFWSVTLYDNEGFLVENPQKKYVVSSQTSLTTETDGSLQLLFQPNAPADSRKASNWLPTPQSKSFCLTLRLYSPEQTVLTKAWVPPAVVLASSA